MPQLILLRTAWKTQRSIAELCNLSKTPCVVSKSLFYTDILSLTYHLHLLRCLSLLLNSWPCNDLCRYTILSVQCLSNLPEHKHLPIFHKHLKRGCGPDCVNHHNKVYIEISSRSYAMYAIEELGMQQQMPKASIPASGGGSGGCMLASKADAGQGHAEPCLGPTRAYYGKSY